MGRLKKEVKDIKKDTIEIKKDIKEQDEDFVEIMVYNSGEPFKFVFNETKHQIQDGKSKVKKEIADFLIKFYSDKVKKI
ncbi:MAG TPA: hypothetical protein PLF61_05845 [Candidatus Goldiibacteriota bacterium]|nr:hypothetical protein [Candidatus Goldiibacteriota bacterium]